MPCVFNANMSFTEVILPASPAPLADAPGAFHLMTKEAAVDELYQAIQTATAIPRIVEDVSADLI